MLEKMMSEAEQIFDYDSKLSSYYIKHVDQMLDDVNKYMTNLDNIFDLLGGNPLDLMMNNHHNHVQFMSNIIKYRQKEVFVHTLPWVYKAYNSKGVKYDYFIEELNAWIRAIDKHVEEDGKQVVTNIYKAMLDWHDELIRICESDEINNFSPSVQWTDDHDTFLQALIKGDYNFVKEFCEQKLNNGSSVSELYIGLLQPVMYKVGELWEVGQITVAHEHLASSMLARVTAAIYPDFVLTDVSKGNAVVSAGVNEHHQLGARMVADVLEANGWQVHYLGANVPKGELIKLIRETKPVFVSLSMTMSYHIDKLVDTVDALREESKSNPFKIMVGGLAFNEEKTLQHLVDADAFPSDALESTKIASEWWQEDRNS